MRILLGEGNVLSLSGEQREIPRTLVYILEGKSASEMASLTFSKFHFPELSRLNLVLLLLNISPIGLKSLLHWPWYWARGSKRVAEEGANVFHDSYNQFISGASSGTAWSLHNSSASDQGEKKKTTTWSHSLLVALLHGSNSLVLKPKQILGHGWKVSILGLFSISSSPATTGKLLSSLSHFFLFCFYYFSFLYMNHFSLQQKKWGRERQQCQGI